MMRIAYPSNSGKFLKQLGWWIFFVICAFYGVFALYMGMIEILSLLGMAADAPHRAVPIVFVMHALTGGVALIGGPLQFNRGILSKRGLQKSVQASTPGHGSD